MSDLISRQAAIDIIEFEDEWLFDAKSHNEDTKIAFSSMKSKISELHSAKPKKGKWGDFWKCSICEKQFDVGTKYHMNFCPNCGADMREV